MSNWTISATRRSLSVFAARSTAAVASGRAGRIKGGRLGVLVEIRKVVVRRSRRKQALIFTDEGQAAGLRRRSVRHHDEPFDLRQFRLQTLQQSDEVVIDEKRRCAGVIDRVGDLLG